MAAAFSWNLIVPISRQNQLAVLLLLLPLLLATSESAAAAAAVVPPQPLVASAGVGGSSSSRSKASAPLCGTNVFDGVLQLAASCSWPAPLPTASERVAVLGARAAPGQHNSVSATPLVFAPTEREAADAAAASRAGTLRGEAHLRPPSIRWL